jgi:plastocyanin
MTRLPCALVALPLMLAACSGASSTPRDEPPSSPPPAASPSLPAQSVVAGRAPVIGGQPSIVVLTPRNARELPAQSSRPVMDQIALTFIPGILIVRTGEPAEFRNSDDVLHNVRVSEDATKAGTFNVAIPMGEDYRHTFERDGFYNVGCDIHPGMTATIYSSPSPFATLTDLSGQFEIHNVAPGDYTAVIFSGPERIERAVDVLAGRTELNFMP